MSPCHDSFIDHIKGVIDVIASVVIVRVASPCGRDRVEWPSQEMLRQVCQSKSLNVAHRRITSPISRPHPCLALLASSSLPC